MPASAPSRVAWLPAAAVLLGAGWGSNQFTPMLLVYEQRLGLSTSMLEALFGAYAAGLIPGLLIAGRWSDAHGRRPVGLAAAALSLLATASLVAGSHATGLLFAGRLLAGLGSGAAFGACTAWLREASLPPFGDVPPATAGRRAAVAMTAGFALGPLVAGLLAQWSPAATIVPYLPHAVLMAIVLPVVAGAPETVVGGRRPVRWDLAGGTGARASRWHWPSSGSERFRRVVAPMAPWVFAAPAIAFALLPSVVGAGRSADGIALTAAITSLTALAGVLIQPLARWLEADARAASSGAIGLIVLTCGLALAALTADVGHLWLLVPCAVVLGSAYGLCLTAGLLEVQRLAPERSLAALTAVYYALTYIGFAAPYLLALASQVAGYPTLLLLAGALAAVTATVVHRATPARQR